MKARVKNTGEIVEVDIYTVTKRGKMFGEVTDSRRLCKPDSTFRKFYRDEIEFLSYEDTPDYWTRLEHQYAGMAMQGMIKRAYNAYCDDCANYENMIFEDAQALLKDHAEALADVCVEFAHALVEKLKESK